MSDKKRGYEGADIGTNKKFKSTDAPTLLSVPASAPALSGDALIAQKRAEIAAKIAAMKKGPTTATATAPIKAPTPMVASSVVSSGPTSTSATATATVTASPSPGVSSDLAKSLAEAKRRVAEAQKKLAVKDNPYMSVALQSKQKNKTPEVTHQGAGLKMAAHPLLLDTTPAAPQSKKDRYKPMQPKFASIKANIRSAPTPPPAPTPVPDRPTSAANPYASNEGFEGPAPKERTNRGFRFNQKGKYVQLGNQMRQDQQLEALKQRIAESAKKAGLDSEFETLEKNIRRPAPPEVEWWDAALLPNKSYNDLELGMKNLNIANDESPITLYIQHPIPIPAPGEKNKVALKPLMLTKKEQKKMRKQRRAAELQDHRDRVRMGLIPPDPPKVRLSNLMKVLTSDAVQDPTRVEARVRREVAMRKHTHEKMNAERKLTDEQRREKIENKKAEEEKKGIYGAVFKVKILSDPAHRFKVRKNAEQLNLTGVCIFNPAFNMVYVEGAARFIKSYKRLMLHRIAWTEPARPRAAEDVELEHPNSDDEAAAAERVAKAGLEEITSSKPNEEEGEQEVSLEDNKCWLVWEGQLRDRAFSTFRPKSCPTDGAAKEVLGEKLKGYWDQAKNWKPEEDELY